MTCIEWPLDRRALVWAVLALAFGLLTWGELRATHLHTSPAFIVGYFWIELQVTAVLLVATGHERRLRRCGT
ncbi:hypothetical protein RA210_U250028 [Rubrivivax sp. A210]|uniref:hypothetical protein n=1 Tax=Rubrivivax sp. A210 TaxID=2772301 RepID=UPI00191A90CE|nr:hypothetical protein [Rubrivivax sp. A210]CAD5372929.1 hypothetical protein RA210_U250028 [Rubrivivax sp. A210]